MDRAEMIKTLQEKEELRERTFAVYQQLLGQIALLRELVTKTDAPKKEEEKK
jgi:hypothetical protein